MRPRRIARLLAFAVLGFAALIGVEVALAYRTDRIEGFTRAQLDGRVGGDGDALRVAWIGDSTSSGVGASALEHALPVVVARGLGRPVDLTVLSVSGARVADAIAEQLPSLADARPDWVFVGIGNNDVTHLTRRPAFRARLEELLDGVDAIQPDRVIVLGIAEFAATPLFAQPLRWLAGVRAHALDEDVRNAAARHGALYVPIRERTGPAFVREPGRTHARDRFHPSDDGYALWAEAVLDTLRLSSAP